MANILIINAHQHYPFSEGRLNLSLTEKAATVISNKGHAIQTTTMKDDYDVATELDKHRWADAIILQSPVNWMGVPWTFKRYTDTVYSAGMEGALCNGDGRTRSDPSKQYGSGGTPGRQTLHDFTDVPCAKGGIRRSGAISVSGPLGRRPCSPYAHELPLFRHAAAADLRVL